MYRILVAIGALLACAAPAHAAGGSAVTVLQSLCWPNHADPVRVIAAADAQGWRPTANSPGADGQVLRIKEIEGVPYVLLTQEFSSDSGGFPHRVRLCQVFAAPGEDVAAEVTAVLGPPVRTNNGFVDWAFTETDGQRRFLPDMYDSTIVAAAKAQAVVMVTVHTEPDSVWVGYVEIAPAR